MKVKKALSMVLLMALLANTMLSCSESAVQEDPAAVTQDTTVQNSVEEETKEETETTRIPTGLPESDFEGYTFNIIYEKVNRYQEVDVDEMNGEIINDAVFQRNSAVETQYNVVIEGIEDAAASSAIQSAVKAGDDTYDITMVTALTTASLATAGVLLDINTVPNIDLSKPWYDQYANAAISLGNKQHMFVGDLNIRDNDSTYLLMFNQKLATEMGITNLYDMAREGTWTMDALITILSDTAMDLNGDGVQNEYDRWGLLGEAWNTNVFIAGTGEYVFLKDENDLPYVAMGSERYYDAFAKAFSINGNREYAFIVDDYSAKYGDGVWQERNKIFAEDRSLFFCGIVGSLKDFREMVTDFGIMPIPKYDEAQEQYHSILTLGQTTAIAVPMSATNLDRTGIVVEALSAEGYYVLTPAYYDNAVTTKYARDDTFTEILDMIFSARIFELGLLYNWGGLFYLPSQLTASNQTDLSSKLAANIKGAEKQAQRTLTALGIE